MKFLSVSWSARPTTSVRPALTARTGADDRSARARPHDDHEHHRDPEEEPRPRRGSATGILSPSSSGHEPRARGTTARGRNAVVAAKNRSRLHPMRAAVHAPRRRRGPRPRRPREPGPTRRPSGRAEDQEQAPTTLGHHGTRRRTRTRRIIWPDHEADEADAEPDQPPELDDLVASSRPEPPRASSLAAGGAPRRRRDARRPGRRRPRARAARPRGPRRLPRPCGSASSAAREGAPPGRTSPATSSTTSSPSTRAP